MMIIPAILPKTRDELIEKLRQLSDTGFSGRIQIDICDGKFVDSITWPFDRNPAHLQSSIDLMNIIKEDEELQGLLSQFQIDLDLMVENPSGKFIVWNAFNPDRVIIHLKSIFDKEGLTLLLAPNSTPYNVINRKALVFAFELDTDIEQFAYWYDHFSMRSVQVMGIETIGRQGEEFSDRTLDVITKIVARYPGVEIMVDGGVSISSINRLSQYGVTACVAGSAVFVNKDILTNIAELQKRATL